MNFRIKNRRKNNLLIPYKRKRLFSDIPFEFRIVQKIRMQVRKASLILWKKYQNATTFDEKIQKKKRMLTLFTKSYHKIQRIRKVLKLKTL